MSMHKAQQKSPRTEVEPFYHSFSDLSSVFLFFSVFFVNFSRLAEKCIRNPLFGYTFSVTKKPYKRQEEKDLKKFLINNNKIFVFVLCIILAASLLCSAAYAMGLPEANGRSGRAGMENNTPENGVVNDMTPGDGNLGDTDGDGIVEDNGNGGGLASDIGDMGSEIISDVGDMGSDIISDVEDGVGINNGASDTSRGTGTDSTPGGEDSGMANDLSDGGSNIVGIVIAVIIAIAVILLIIALIPKNKNKH